MTDSVVTDNDALPCNARQKEINVHQAGIYAWTELEVGLPRKWDYRKWDYPRSGITQEVGLQEVGLPRKWDYRKRDYPAKQFLFESV